MDRWQAVRNIIENNKKFILFTHISADGDALGSVTALALFLNKMGKETFILLEENPQTVLRYVLDKDINYGIYSENEVYPEFDVSIAIDTASKDRLGKRSQIFEKSNYCVSIDHHQSKEFFAQINVCNPMWAATCEGIWELMETYADVEDKDICQSIFTGIMTDTGSFAYSNTTSNTHMIATKIINICGDQSWQYRRIFESVTKSELDLRRIAYSKLEYYFDNTVVLLQLDADEMEKCNATREQLESFAPFLRTIEGVCTGIFVKPQDENGVRRISLRSDGSCNVGCVAASFGGGGHSCAAGITYDPNKANCDFESFKEKIIKEVEAWTE